MTQPDTHRLLRKAARVYGVATSYQDFESKKVDIADAALVRLINALQGEAVLSEPVRSEALQDLLTKARARKIACGLPAVVVAWDGAFPGVWLWLAAKTSGDVTVTLRPETGEPLTWTQKVTNGTCIRRKEGLRFRLQSPVEIPFGYYDLDVQVDGKQTASSFLISTPFKLQHDHKNWGAFVPTYGLQGQQPTDIGDYGKLKQAAEFVHEAGGSFLGTLPLLATYYDGDKKNASPYSPISRLFWNEIYLDLDRLPGETPAAVQSSESGQEIFVDYDAAYARKKAVLSQTADLFFAAHPQGDEDFKSYAALNPCLYDYADFRAAEAPAPQRKQTRNFHLYAQYACHLQLSALQQAAAAGKAAELYIDYPIGQHTGGFDAQHFSHLFIPGFQVGAPPDLFFSKGQGWGFQPFHPRAFEHDRFAYFRASLHHYFSYARMLRLDHVMGLYRIFCIPDGMEGKDGGYIYYPFQAFLAVLCLEAHLHNGILIGEDLGTVPDSVGEGMKAHDLNRMWILQFQIKDDPKESFKTVEPAMIAGFNTHDMFPFLSFLSGKDMEELERLDLMQPAEAKKILDARRTLLKEWKKSKNPFLLGLEGLANSPARHVMVAMEDFWGETEPQNVPGTVDQYPNWRKKLAVPIEAWHDHPAIKQATAILNRTRGHHDQAE